jgi:hypothetical protein
MTGLLIACLVVFGMIWPINPNKNKTKYPHI